MPAAKYLQNYLEITDKYKNLNINGTKKLLLNKTFALHSLVKWFF